jgi:hypothetical protein
MEVRDVAGHAVLLGGAALPRGASGLGVGGCTVPCVPFARRAHDEDALRVVAFALQAGIFAHGTGGLCEIALAVVTSRSQPLSLLLVVRLGVDCATHCGTYSFSPFPAGEAALGAARNPYHNGRLGRAFGMVETR